MRIVFNCFHQKLVEKWITIHNGQIKCLSSSREGYVSIYILFQRLDVAIIRHFRDYRFGDRKFRNYKFLVKFCPWLWHFSMTPQVIFLEDISVTNFSLSDKYSDNEKIVTNISVTRPCATGILTWMKFGRLFKKAKCSFLSSFGPAHSAPD